jgi:hypothetical protein
MKKTNEKSVDAGSSFQALVQKYTRKRKRSKRTGGPGAGRPAGEEEQQAS